MRPAAAIFIITAGIVFSGFQQTPAPNQGQPKQEPANATQGKPRPTKHLAEAPTTSSTEANTQPANVHDKDNQTIEVISSTPKETVDYVGRAIGLLGLFCTLALTGVGIRGVFIALDTLTQMKGQRRAMLAQWCAMRRQVREMKLQVVEMQKQTGHLEGSVSAAKTSAVAAQTSAANDERAVRLTQRADVLIEDFEVRKHSSQSIIGRDTQFVIHFKNFGPTRASEVSTDFSAEIPEAKKMVATNPVLKPPITPIVYGAGDKKNVTFNRLCECYDDKTIDKIIDGSFSVHLFGTIKYRDVFGANHTVRCGATWTSTLYTFVADVTEIEEQPSENGDQQAN